MFGKLSALCRVELKKTEGERERECERQKKRGRERKREVPMSRMEAGNSVGAGGQVLKNPSFTV